MDSWFGKQQEVSETPPTKLRMEGFVIDVKAIEKDMAERLRENENRLKAEEEKKNRAQREHTEARAMRLLREKEERIRAQQEEKQFKEKKRTEKEKQKALPDPLTLPLQAIALSRLEVRPSWFPFPHSPPEVPRMKESGDVSEEVQESRDRAEDMTTQNDWEEKRRETTERRQRAFQHHHDLGSSLTRFFEEETTKLDRQTQHSSQALSKWCKTIESQRLEAFLLLGEGLLSALDSSSSSSERDFVSCGEDEEDTDFVDLDDEER